MADRTLLPGEYAVLGLLRLQPMHGYEMVGFLAGEGLVDVCPVEQGTLYTYLRNLEGRKLVSWSEARVGLRPPRKTYALTDAGRACVEAWLRQPVERMREVRGEFLLKLFFLERTDPAGHRRLVAAQVAACRDYLANLERKNGGTRFSRLVTESKRTAAEATLGWLTAYSAEVSTGDAS